MKRTNDWVRAATGAGGVAIRWKDADELRRRLGSGEFAEPLRARGTDLRLSLSVAGEHQVVAVIDAWAVDEGERDEDIVTLRDALADDVCRLTDCAAASPPVVAATRLHARLQTSIPPQVTSCLLDRWHLRLAAPSRLTCYAGIDFVRVSAEVGLRTWRSRSRPPRRPWWLKNAWFRSRAT